MPGDTARNVFWQLCGVSETKTKGSTHLPNHLLLAEEPVRNHLVQVAVRAVAVTKPFVDLPDVELPTGYREYTGPIANVQLGYCAHINYGSSKS